MSHRWNSVKGRVPHLAAAAACAVVLSASAAFAQSAPAPAAAAPAGAPASPWIKTCGQDPQSKKQICVIQQELRAETNQFIAALRFTKVEGDTKTVLTALVLTGQYLPPGVRVQVDQNKPAELKYAVCDSGVCVAQGDVDDAYVAAMKKGTKIVSMTLNPQGKPMLFPFALTGFKKVYEGPGLDAAASQAKRDELQKRLQQSADQNRQKLIDQQNKELNNGN